MNNFLQNLASDLIQAVKYLEKEKKDTTTQEREKALQTIFKVLDMKMDLNQKIFNGIFYSTLNLYAEKSIVESELILLLNVLLKLFENYTGKPYFLNKNEESNNLISFLVKLSLRYLNVSNSSELSQSFRVTRRKFLL